MTKLIERIRKGAAERSAENYIKAIETEVMALRTDKIKLSNGTYGIKDNGNICPDKSITCDAESEIKIDMSGTKPKGGYITITNKKVSPTGSRISIGDYIIVIDSNGETLSYKQTYNPQYYGDWSFSGTIGSTSAPENPTLIPPAGKKFYFGYDVADGVVSAAYVCFKSDDELEYCLKGGNSEAILNSNKKIMDKAFSSCSSSNPNYNYSCSSGNIFVGAYTNYVVFDENGFGCDVDNNSFRCRYM